MEDTAYSDPGRRRGHVSHDNFRRRTVVRRNSDWDRRLYPCRSAGSRMEPAEFKLRPCYHCNMHTAAALALARQHVEDGRRRVAEQRDRVARMMAAGQDAGQAESLLRVMLDILAKMERHREAIEAAADR